jgi:hypothetical protein
MNKSKLGLLTVITVLLFSFTVAFVAAQYQTEKTTKVTFESDGMFTASETDVGISYEIQGTPGASGTVTADVYNGNPQPTANLPAGTSLVHFVVVTFNINADDFKSAKIVISYSDNDVQGISAPYTIYKYNPDSNSYIVLPSTLDTAAKTITVRVTSLSDPLFAIGGATASTAPSGLSAVSWGLIIVTVIVIVLLAGLLVSRKLSPTAKNSEYSFEA